MLRGREAEQPAAARLKEGLLSLRNFFFLFFFFSIFLTLVLNCHWAQLRGQVMVCMDYRHY